MKKIAFVVGLIGIMATVACHHELIGNTCADGNTDACTSVGTHKHWWDTYLLPPNDADDMSFPPGDGDPTASMDGGSTRHPNCRLTGTCPDMAVASSVDMSEGGNSTADLSSAPSDLSNVPRDAHSGWECDGKTIKLDSDQVGIVGASVSGNGLTITITSWSMKTDEAGSYYGFTYTTSGSGTLASYLVKGGQDLFEGYTNPWSNPYGTSGPSVHGISHIDFCVW